MKIVRENINFERGNPRKTLGLTQIRASDIANLLQAYCDFYKLKRYYPYYIIDLVDDYIVRWNWTEWNYRTEVEDFLYPYKGSDNEIWPNIIDLREEYYYHLGFTTKGSWTGAIVVPEDWNELYYLQMSDITKEDLSDLTSIFQLLKYCNGLVRTRKRKYEFDPESVNNES
jgi:hypothetical protein